MKTTLLNRSTEYKRLSVLISKLPEIRYDRVNELKTSISKGTYNIKPYQIVDKIICEGVYMLRKMKIRRTIFM